VLGSPGPHEPLATSASHLAMVACMFATSSSSAASLPLFASMTWRGRGAVSRKAPWADRREQAARRAGGRAHVGRHLLGDGGRGVLHGRRVRRVGAAGCDGAARVSAARSSQPQTPARGPAALTPRHLQPASATGSPLQAPAGSGRRPGAPVSRARRPSSAATIASLSSLAGSPNFSQACLSFFSALACGDQRGDGVIISWR
jgi:hypothetical protein